MLKSFRVISLLEGLSYLVILSVTLGFISREYVSILGITHGVLFIAYFLMSLQVSHKQSWSVFVWLLVLCAAVVPFAFIGVDLYLQKQISKRDQS